jgi:hypothetical protein
MSTLSNKCLQPLNFHFQTSYTFISLGYKLNLLSNSVIPLAYCSQMSLDCAFVLLNFFLERVKFRFKLTDRLLKHSFCLSLLLLSCLQSSSLAFCLPLLNKGRFFRFEFYFEGIFTV